MRKEGAGLSLAGSAHGGGLGFTLYTADGQELRLEVEEGLVRMLVNDPDGGLGSALLQLHEALMLQRALSAFTGVPIAEDQGRVAGVVRAANIAERRDSEAE